METLIDKVADALIERMKCNSCGRVAEFVPYVDEQLTSEPRLISSWEEYWSLRREKKVVETSPKDQHLTCAACLQLTNRQRGFLKLELETRGTRLLGQFQKLVLDSRSNLTP